MARRVFFSFHYENDVWRANQVRHSWVTKPGAEEAGFVDAADFEKVRKEGDTAVKRWIDRQLEGTSVTVVLIGSETSKREYVKYEIMRSLEKGNGLLGIYINQMKDQYGLTSLQGSNSFGEIGKDRLGNSIFFSINFPTYDWVNDNGYQNLGTWIANAASQAGR